MIIALIGNVGSGKSVTAVKRIVDRNVPNFTNFGCKHASSTRLKVENIIKEGKVNYKFWKEQAKNFDIYLDEVHNIIHSRRAMTKFNINMTQWISQIRKILGSSEKNNIYLISQRLARIDVAFRDLLHAIVYCYKIIDENDLIETIVVENGRRKKKLMPKVYIMQVFFTGETCIRNYEAWFYNSAMKTYTKRIMYLANPYFKYYDSYELIDWDGEYL